MRKKFIAGNWKMNMNLTEAAKLVEEFRNTINTEEVDTLICPPYVLISEVAGILRDTNIAVGAQNMHFEDKGAFTGEISADMLKDLNVKYVILGHSERRQIFHETDEMVNKKVLKAIEKGLLPIVCVGETLDEREEDITIEKITNQVEVAMRDVAAEDAKDLTIAYEPIWAIGTGKTATAEQAEEVCEEIRNVVRRLYGKEVSDVLRIQYGGSVKPANAKEILSMPNIDGALVGGAALKPEFKDIVHYN